MKKLLLILLLLPMVTTIQAQEFWKSETFKVGDDFFKHDYHTKTYSIVGGKFVWRHEYKCNNANEIFMKLIKSPNTGIKTVNDSFYVCVSRFRDNFSRVFGAAGSASPFTVYYTLSITNSGYIVDIVDIYINRSTDVKPIAYTDCSLPKKDKDLYNFESSLVSFFDILNNPLF